jgi:transcriptional regulator with XRE-family HTH domain
LSVPKKNLSAATSRVIRLIREERVRAGVSIYRLSKRSGVSQQMIGYVERGLRIPSLDTLLRIANALDVDLSKVIKKATRR